MDTQQEIPETVETPLDLILRLGAILKKKEQEIQEIENDLELKKAEYNKIARVMLPEQMEELGIENITLKDGSKISLQKYYKAKIPEPLWHDAVQWLEENNHDGIIKAGFSVSFPKGEKDNAKKAADLLRQHGIPVIVQDSIHHSTLRAFVREQIEQKEPLPRELFGVEEGSFVKFN